MILTVGEHVEILAHVDSSYGVYADGKSVTYIGNTTMFFLLLELIGAIQPEGSANRAYEFEQDQVRKISEAKNNYSVFYGGRTFGVPVAHRGPNNGDSFCKKTVDENLLADKKISQECRRLLRKAEFVIVFQ